MVSPSKKTKAPSFHGKLRIILFVATVVIVVLVLLQKSHHVEIASELNSNIIKHNGESKEIVDKPTYKPASTEEYIMTHMQELGYHPKNMWGAGCKIWESPEVSNQENFDSLHAFKEDLKTYKKAVEAFNKTATGDILHKIRHGNGEESQSEICKAARPHPDGIQALFPSKQLSFTKNGFVEPLLTPMRNPRFCEDTTKLQLDIDYIIHDFEAMCLQLKPASKIVLIDMGASLAFHSSGKQPAIVLMEQFEKFGLYFDQIFAFEVTPQDPIKVYRELLPQKYISSYHWINTGVSADKDDKMNPLYSVISKLHEDDLVIVKLDIDAPGIEQELFETLLEDDLVNKLVDHFYFEHHHRLYEMRAWWGSGFKNIWNISSVQDSFEKMSGLRKKGVASHYWV